MSTTPERAPVPWLATLRDWPIAALQALQREGAVARVVLAQVRGSAPREPGVVMLVGRDSVDGTIGGGQLEWEAIAAARALLSGSGPAARVQRLTLGADLGQCCGGVVELWIERFNGEDLKLLRAAQEALRRGPVLLRSTLRADRVERQLIDGPSDALDADRMLGAVRAHPAPSLLHAQEGQSSLLERLDDAQPPVWLFGAGYVGQALARMLMELPLRLTWIDSRRELFPAPLPQWLQILHGDPVASVAAAPVGTHYLVLTHNHALDYALCHAVLTRANFGSLGLIGSKSKAARFRSRLARHGMSAERIARLVCPIGISGIASKWPAAIAVGVAAQLMQQISAERAATAAVTPGRHLGHGVQLDHGAHLESCAVGCEQCRPGVVASA